MVMISRKGVQNVSALFFLFLEFTVARPPASPCPSIFAYEGEIEQDRWYGVITFTSNIELAGLSIKIQLDRPSQLLVSWDGEIRSVDNTYYYIFNPYLIQRAGDVMKARIMSKFNSKQGIPVIRSIIINGNTVCSGGTVIVPSGSSSAVGLEGRPRQPTTTQRYDPTFNSDVDNIANEFVNKGNSHSGTDENSNYFPSVDSSSHNQGSSSSGSRFPDWGDSPSGNSPGSSEVSHSRPDWPESPSSNNIVPQEWPASSQNVNSAESNVGINRPQTSNSGSSSASSWPSTVNTANQPSLTNSESQVWQSNVNSRPQVQPANKPSVPQTDSQSWSSNTNTRPQIQVSSGSQQTQSNSDSQTWQGNTNNRPQTSQASSLGGSPLNSNLQPSYHNSVVSNTQSSYESTSKQNGVQNEPIVTTLTLPTGQNRSIDQIVELIKNQLEQKVNAGGGNSTYIVAVLNPNSNPNPNLNPTTQTSTTVATTVRITSPKSTQAPTRIRTPAATRP